MSLLLWRVFNNYISIILLLHMKHLELIYSACDMQCQLSSHQLPTIFTFLHVSFFHMSFSLFIWPKYPHMKEAVVDLSQILSNFGDYRESLNIFISKICMHKGGGKQSLS